MMIDDRFRYLVAFGFDSQSIYSFSQFSYFRIHVVVAGLYDESCSMSVASRFNLWIVIVPFCTRNWSLSMSCLFVHSS
ncbi:hypothetical protein LINGRAHAP2_LOCUS1416, partial [Linum grandiflorum]